MASRMLHSWGITRSLHLWSNRSWRLWGAGVGFGWLIGAFTGGIAGYNCVGARYLELETTTQIQSKRLRKQTETIEGLQEALTNLGAIVKQHPK